MRQLALLSLALVLAAPELAAQAGATGTASVATASTRRCPMPNGVRIGVAGIDTGGARGVTIGTGTTLDTTFTLNIAERRWTQPSLTASLEAGVGDTARARWFACTGVSISMQNVTLLMRQVRGQIRYRVDLTPLLNVGRVGAARGTTPPD